MKKVLRLLITFLFLCVCQNSSADLSSDTDYIPNPDSAILVFADNDWLVWEKRTVVKGTEMRRAPTFTFSYYLQSEIEGPAQNFYEYRSTGPDGIVGVLTDGTVVFLWSRTNAYIKLVNLEGPVCDINIDGLFPDRKLKASSLGLTDKGILVQPYNLNEEEPIYFIPWGKNKTTLGEKKKKIVTDAGGIDVNNGMAFWHENLIVSWNAPKLFIYDISTNKLNTIEVKKYREDWWFPGIVFFDGETVIIQNEKNKILLDIPSSKQSLLQIPGQVLHIKDKVVYTIKHKDRSYKKGKYAYQLVAYELNSPQAEERILYDMGYDWSPEEGIIIRKAALWLWKEGKWNRFEWL